MTVYEVIVQALELRIRNKQHKYERTSRFWFRERSALRSTIATLENRLTMFKSEQLVDPNFSLEEEFDTNKHHHYAQRIVYFCDC